MLILDTNILSEFMRSSPDPSVVKWADGRTEKVVTTAVTIAELGSGVASMDDGPRKQFVTEAFDRMKSVYIYEVLPFDEASALEYATLRARFSRAGRDVGVMDLLIASITLAHDGAIATRNTKHFEGLVPRIINPFDFG